MLLLQPMVGMMAVTGAVWVTMYVKRLGYIQREKLDLATINTPEKMNSVIPEHLNHTSNNLKNLFELPVIFYAVCLASSQLPFDSSLMSTLAWAFVVLRAIHSFVQCTSNIVMLRFAFYLLSSVVLWVMVGRLAVEVF